MRLILPLQTEYEKGYFQGLKDLEMDLPTEQFDLVIALMNAAYFAGQEKGK